MTNPLHFVMVLHQHQPVGNLDAVNESIYRDCYQPLVEVLADYPALPVNLHTSGSLVDWLAARHPEYLHRLRELVAAGHIEILGGAYHDPILPMLSRADRCGQIESFGRRLGQLFGHIPRGMWLRGAHLGARPGGRPGSGGHRAYGDRRFSFSPAGLSDAQLRGYYLTESEGSLIALFPGDERLRYLIPFAEPEETIAYLRQVAAAHPGGVIVYADDAEKFGAWPGMRERDHQRRWLRRFLDALAANSDWLRVTTLGECVDHVAPLGKVYVPEGSLSRNGALVHARAGRGSTGTPGGGTCGTACSAPGAISASDTRKSTRCTAACSWSAAASRRPRPPDDDSPLVEQARQSLYRAQCGCAYWHGIFGGVYLPHMRQAVYRHLIEAETLLDAAEGRTEPWVSAAIDDFNLDVHKELLLANGKLTLLVAPDRGGQLYELDVRDVRANLLATLVRRPEPYHRDYAGSGLSASGGDSVAPPQLIYDAYPRKSLLDHFFDPRTTLDEVATGTAIERGDFLGGRYRARLRRVRGGICAQLARRGTAFAQPVTVSKQLTLWADRSTIDIHYELEGLPPGRPWHFAVEFNFAGLPPGCPDRYFVDAQGRVLADLGRRLDLAGAGSLRLVDRWLGLDIGLSTTEAGGIWAFPIQSISRSQRGLEMIQQSVAVVPHWTVVGNAEGRWSVELQLSLVTAAAAAPPRAAPQASETAAPVRRCRVSRTSPPSSSWTVRTRTSHPNQSSRHTPGTFTKGEASSVSKNADWLRSAVPRLEQASRGTGERRRES